MTDAELYLLPPWTNPFLPSVHEPTLEPWVSPGRVSIAPGPPAVDRLTWGAAVFAAMNLGRPPWVYRFLAAQVDALSQSRRGGR
jgi:hypothetical protein